MLVRAWTFAAQIVGHRDTTGLRKKAMLGVIMEEETNVVKVLSSKVRAKCSRTERDRAVCLTMGTAEVDSLFCRIWSYCSGEGF